jgi:hypothetical protein
VSGRSAATGPAASSRASDNKPTGFFMPAP